MKKNSVRPGDVVVFCSGIVDDRWREVVDGPCLILSVELEKRKICFGKGMYYSTALWSMALNKRGMVVWLQQNLMRDTRQQKWR